MDDLQALAELTTPADTISVLVKDEEVQEAAKRFKAAYPPSSPDNDSREPISIPTKGESSGKPTAWEDKHIDPTTPSTSDADSDMGEDDLHTHVERFHGPLGQWSRASAASLPITQAAAAMTTPAPSPLQFPPLTLHPSAQPLLNAPTGSRPSSTSARYIPMSELGKVQQMLTTIAGGSWSPGLEFTLPPVSGESWSQGSGHALIRELQSILNSWIPVLAQQAPPDVPYEPPAPMDRDAYVTQKQQFIVATKKAIEDSMRITRELQASLAELETADTQDPPDTITAQDYETFPDVARVTNYKSHIPPTSASKLQLTLAQMSVKTVQQRLQNSGIKEEEEELTLTTPGYHLGGRPQGLRLWTTPKVYPNNQRQSVMQLSEVTA